MKQWGISFIIFAIGSLLLPMLGVQFIIMAWVDLWGPTIGYIIRGVMLVAGIAMLVLGSDSDE